MMTSRVRAGLRVLFLAAFVALTLGINFLHTESGPGARGDCPACQFLSSSLSTSPGAVFVVPALLYRGTLVPAEPLRSNEAVILTLCSRSPPQV